MPVRVFPPQNHSDHRIQLLKDIKKFKAGNGSNPLLSSAVESLLNSMVSYLEHDNSQDEDFDDVDDEDFLLVETADTSLDTSRLDLKRSSDFDDEPPSEKVKDGDEPPSKKVKVDDEPPSKKVNVEMAPVATSVARKILRGTWGFPGFKLLQEAAITRLISGCSAAVVFPTGGGKSLVYQVPALAFDDYDELCNRTRGGGVTLVVSPLIALMKVR